MPGIFLRGLRRYDAFSDLYESQSSLCFMYQVSKHTGNPCIYVLPASRTISIGPADCPSRSCVSCEVIYCSLELDARFRCRTFHVSYPHLLRRYFHLSIFHLLPFSLTHSPFLSHSPSPFVSIFLALFALADNKIPAADRDGKENIFWRRKLSRTRHREHKQQLERRKEEDGRWKEERERDEEFSLVMQREAESTYRQIHNKTICVFLFLLLSRKCVRSSLSTCLVSGDTGIYNPG